ncbi:MAG: amidohydrolase family protein [Halobacteriaceae archaeon]
MLLSGEHVVLDARSARTDAAVRVADGVVTDVGDRDALVDRFPEERERRVDILAPGLVAGHVHTVHGVARGIDDDSPLGPWLGDAVLPLEAALDAERTRDAARLGYLECLRNGVTTVVDHTHPVHHEPVLEVAAASGLRACLGPLLCDRDVRVPGSLVTPADDALADCERALDAWHRAAGGRLRVALTPRSPLSCSRRLLRGAADLVADHQGARLHTHVAETRREVARTVAVHGERPVAVLASVGALGGDLIGAHGVWTSEAERAALAAAGATVAHCPSANAKLGSGVAPVPDYRRREIPVALGNDGAACNDTLDPLAELRQAALVHRAERRDPGAVDASAALEMATTSGAAAAGFERVGALREGWAADAVGLTTARAGATPVRDPVSHLVFAARGGDVRLVVVDGEVLLEDGEPTRWDADAVRGRGRSVAVSVDEERRRWTDRSS